MLKVDLFQFTHRLSSYCGFCVTSCNGVTSVSEESYCLQLGLPRSRILRDIPYFMPESCVPFYASLSRTNVLVVNVSFQLPSQHKYRENEGVTITWTPILQTRQNWHNHLPHKTAAKKVFFFRMDSSINCRTSFYIRISVARHVTHHAALKPRVFSW